MATFFGHYPSRVLFAPVARQSSNLNTPRSLPERFAASHLSATKAGVIINLGAPTFTAYQTQSGCLSGSLALNFYNRIWLNPLHLELGNVVSVQQFPVSLWNAYFSPRSLSAIDQENNEGIILNGPTTPLALPALTEIIWQLQADINGPPMIDGRFVFQIINESPLLLTFTGQRIIAFTFAPNWQDGIAESLQWYTEILTSEQGHEQRRALRAYPRRRVKADFLLAANERQRFDLLLSQWGSRIFALPTWTDAIYLDQSLPSNSPFIPCNPFGFTDLALLRQSMTDFEVVEIDQIMSTGLKLKRYTAHHWPPGTSLLPLRRALLEKPAVIKRKTDNLWHIEIDFLQNEPTFFSADSPMPDYRNVPVLELAPEESEDLTASYQRLTQLLDNHTALPQLYDFAGRSFFSLSHGFLAASREERHALLSLFYALNGRQKILWLPTFADDLKLIAPLAPTALQMDIESVDMNRFFKRRDIRIELVDGHIIYRRIHSATPLNKHSERLALSSPTGLLIEPHTVKRISYLNLVRQDTDHITLRHLSDSVCRTKTVFREVRDEL